MEYTYYRCRCCGQENSITEEKCTRCRAKLAMYGDVISGDNIIEKTDNQIELSSKKKSKNEKKKKSKLFLILFIISFIANIGLAILFGICYSDMDFYETRYMNLDDDYVELENKYNDLSDDYNELENKYNDLSDDYDELKNKYDFFDKYARIVPDDYSNTYHRYGCSELNEDVDFWIYNIDNAVNYAEPCISCCSDD